MNCLINKSYLENKMKEITEQIKQIWKTEEDYVKYRSEINYYMGYRNALGDLIDKINEVKL